MPKKKYLVLYMPVLHRGYLQLFNKYSAAEHVLVLNSYFLNRTDYIKKDLRSLTPKQQVHAIKGLGLFKTVGLASKSVISQIDKKDIEIILPDEDVSRDFAESLKLAKTILYPVFLRWDRRSVEAINHHDVDKTITEDSVHKIVMDEALAKAESSSDIWRRVGAVLIAKDEKLSAANQGEPTQHSPWMEGDPRNIYKRGVGIEMSLFTHAEAMVIADAAKRGVKLAGAKLYVSTFPCPACAKLIAHSGIKTCYYKDGYAVLDGASIMRQYGVELIRVLANDKPNPTGPKTVSYNN